MEIFKLIGSIMVDTADAEKSIQKTGDDAEKLGNTFADGMKTAGKWAMGLAAGAVAVGGAMVNAAKETAAAMDDVDKASQRMKMDVESYQELAYAAEMSGVEMSTLEQAAKKLEGTGLSMDDALAEIYSLETAEERAAKAAELFGDSVAYKMTPLLNNSAEDMADMAQEARDLGLVMSEDAVKNGAAMNDMFTKVEESISALKNGLVADLMPYVMEILDWVIENIPMIRETIASVMDAVIPIVRPILDAIMQMLPPIMNAIKKLMDFIIPYIKPVIESISSLVKGFMALMNGDIEGFAEGIINFLGGIVNTFFNLGQAIFGALWDGLVSIWNGIVQWIQNSFGWLAEKLGAVGRFLGLGGGGEGESHAGGLPLVPYDNYPAMLHRGESVMTAADTQSLLETVRQIANNSMGGGTFNITVQSVLDGRIVGESVTRYQMQKARATG